MGNEWSQHRRPKTAHTAPRLSTQASSSSDTAHRSLPEHPLKPQGGINNSDVSTQSQTDRSRSNEIARDGASCVSSDISEETGTGLHADDVPIPESPSPILISNNDFAY